MFVLSCFFGSVSDLGNQVDLSALDDCSKAARRIEREIETKGASIFFPLSVIDTIILIFIPRARHEYKHTDVCPHRQSL